MTISYSTKKQRKNQRPPKAPESRSALGINKVPSGKKAVGLWVAVECYLDDQQTATRWYKGSVISYSRKGYVITFDGYGPEEHEIVSMV